MSDMTCPTVKIKSSDGFIIINKSDFDSRLHTLYEETPCADERSVSDEYDEHDESVKTDRKKKK